MYKIGTGYDSHQFVKGIPLYLGGITIDYPMGLKGHSDGDVIIHAIIDAIVSPTLNKNIGELFPNSNKKYIGISSLLLLENAYSFVKQECFKLINVDVTFIAEEPKISDYTLKMRETLAHTLDTQISNISIKGKSNEQMGFIGRKEGAAAIAVALLKYIK
jgi:2-C-methyl-D-erythritol 2,4-cyclodiphosphate synthase